MEDRKILIQNIDKLHTTNMGIERIRRNLKVDIIDVDGYCREKILNPNCNIYKQGKTGTVK